MTSCARYRREATASTFALASWAFKASPSVGARRAVGAVPSLGKGARSRFRYRASEVDCTSAPAAWSNQLLATTPCTLGTVPVKSVAWPGGRHRGRGLEARLADAEALLGGAAKAVGQLLPQALQRGGAKKGGARYDGNICLGAVVRGATPHFDYVAAEVSKGIAQVSLESGIPVLFGVLTTETLQQAIERAGSKAGNKGFAAAEAAIEMVNLLKAMGA